MDTDTLLTFLQTHVDPTCRDLEPLAAGMGMFSQAYGFRTDEGAFVLRLNRFREDFEKDRFAYAHLRQPHLPIPKVFTIGSFDAQTHYCISERCAGVNLNELEAERLEHLTPDLFAKLQAIHQTDVRGQAGWGLTDAVAVGRFESWAGSLWSLYNQKFSFNLPQLYDTTMLERLPFHLFLREMQRLLPYASDEKCLLHGDFGFKNVMSDGERITGVLDWAEMRLGDPLYDVAYLEFWSESIPYGEQWLEWVQEKPRHYHERLRLYGLYHGLSSLIIAAIQDDTEDYAWVKARTERYLG